MLLEKLSPEEFDKVIRTMKSKENEAIADMVLHLCEMDKRQFFRELGYSSLFSYCTEGLKYSEGASYRRIQAARALKEHPDIYDKLKSGLLSLCTVAEVSRVRDESKKTNLISKAEGKSKREVERLVSPLLPPVKSKKSSIRVVQREVAPAPIFESSTSTRETEESYALSVQLDKETYELLNRVKEHTGYIPLNELLKRTFRHFVNDKARDSRARKIKVLKKSRYISLSVRKTVRKRDQGQCTFVSKSGKRCSERCGLEYDHIVPFSTGGSNEVNNLRLRCRGHNQLHAEETFGREFMQGKRANVFK